MWLFVHPKGVEPISSESESDILSIILRVQNRFAKLNYYKRGRKKVC